MTVVTPDILTLSKLACPSTSRTPLAVILVNVPAAGVAPPIIVLSTVPAFISAVVTTSDENVPAAGVDPPITELSIVPPLMSAVVATKDPIVPKLVRDELTIPDPSVLASRTVVLFILYDLPDAILIFSDEPKLSPVASNCQDLSPSPESMVIPAPSAAASFIAPVATCIFLSSIFTVVELIVVVVPSTCRSPATTTVPVLSPTAAGSRVMVAGPDIVLFVTLIADPSAPVKKEGKKR